MNPLQRLRQAGELTLVRSCWCEPESGEDDGWRQILSAEQGLRLVRDGLAVIKRGKILRPAPKPVGGGDD